MSDTKPPSVFRFRVREGNKEQATMRDEVRRIFLSHLESRGLVRYTATMIPDSATWDAEVELTLEEGYFHEES